VPACAQSGPNCRVVVTSSIHAPIPRGGFVHWVDSNHACGVHKGTDNALVESFNGRLRDECLNTHWFLSLDDARAKLETWRRDFNETRPHTSLGFMMPAEFASSAVVNPADEGPDLSYWPDTKPGQDQRLQHRKIAA
jgi:hypothetical protein